MTRAEFARWCVFYRDQPFDDDHRFNRPAALVASSMSGDMQAKLDWLRPAPRDDGGLDVLRSLPGVKFHPKKES